MEFFLTQRIDHLTVMKQVLFRRSKLHIGSPIITKHKKTPISNKKKKTIKKLIAVCKVVSNIILLWGLLQDTFKKIKQNISCEVYFEDKNWMNRVKVMPPKVRTILFIWLYDVENSALLINLTWNAKIKKIRNTAKCNS